MPLAGVGVPPPSASLALWCGAIAGAVAGFLIGAVFGIGAVAQDFAAAGLLFIPVLALLGAVVGGVVTILPGAAIAIMVQRIDATPSAPAVGAVLGAILGAGLFAWLGNSGDADSGEKIVAFVGFLAGGLCGGLAGGLVLKRSCAVR